MFGTRIFVSHSSRDNALTREVCDLLQQPHSDGGASYETLVDLDSLEDGDPWPQQLHEMMADCHAAVVLLSKNAVASAWVLKELTILSWRRCLEREFKLFIAQFPEVTQAELSHGRFDPLQHRLVQNIASSDAAEIAARVRAQLDRDAVRPAETFFDRLVKALTQIIANVNVEEAALAEIANKLGLQPPLWRPRDAPNRDRATRMAVALLRGQLGLYADLRELMNELRSARLPTAELADMLRLIASHWVESEAAGLLGGLVENEQGVVRCKAAAINGRYARRYTGLMYVQRAFPLASELRVHGATPALPGNPLEHYTKSIYDYCKKFERYEDMSIDEFVDEMKVGDPWLFVVIGRVDGRALKELRDRFPLVRFIVHMAGPGLEAATVPAGAVCLLPPVDTVMEGRQQDSYFLAKNVITNIP